MPSAAVDVFDVMGLHVKRALMKPRQDPVLRRGDDKARIVTNNRVSVGFVTDAHKFMCVTVPLYQCALCICDCYVVRDSGLCM